MPIYYVAYTLFSDVEPYWRPLSREIPAHWIKNLLPAIVLGYVVPLLLVFAPWSSPSTIQNLAAFWQSAPVLVPLLTTLFGKIILKLSGVKHTPTMNAAEQPKDLPYLRTIYLFTFFLGAALHIYIFSDLLISTDSTLSISSVFVPDFSATPKALGEGLRNVFLADFWAFCIASYGWYCSAVWDIKRVGRTTLDVGKASIVISFANIIVGPGAAMAGTWYWREIAMACTSVSMA